ncbi:MAG: hypothetical protein QOJ59_5558 [Thermomicrobiales bacterium]|nr:hypothetical protein [Thermomicrobiales bacterium]
MHPNERLEKEAGRSPCPACRHLQPAHHLHFGTFAAPPDQRTSNSARNDASLASPNIPTKSANGTGRLLIAQRQWGWARRASAASQLAKSLCAAWRRHALQVAQPDLPSADSAAGSKMYTVRTIPRPAGNVRARAARPCVNPIAAATTAMASLPRPRRVVSKRPAASAMQKDLQWRLLPASTELSTCATR